MLICLFICFFVLQLKLRQSYYASTSYVDALVGRLLEALDNNGFAGSTTIIFIGDNGEILFFFVIVYFSTCHWLAIVSKNISCFHDAHQMILETDVERVWYRRAIIRKKNRQEERERNKTCRSADGRGSLTEWVRTTWLQPDPGARCFAVHGDTRRAPTAREVNDKNSQ